MSQICLDDYLKVLHLHSLNKNIKKNIILTRKLSNQFLTRVFSTLSVKITEVAIFVAAVVSVMRWFQWRLEPQMIYLKVKWTLTIVTIDYFDSFLRENSSGVALVDIVGR